MVFGVKLCVTALNQLGERVKSNTDFFLHSVYCSKFNNVLRFGIFRTKQSVKRKRVRPSYTSNVSCAEPNVNELQQRSIIMIIISL